MITRFFLRSVFVFLTWPLQILFRGIGNLVEAALSRGIIKPKPVF